MEKVCVYISHRSRMALHVSLRVCCKWYRYATKGLDCLS